MWKTNLAICATMVALVAGYFFYQVHKASEQFRKNSREHSKVLAAAVELNIRNAILSNDGLELIIEGFLKNSARFISFLNIIEQFNVEELSSFARETGLAGITIIGGSDMQRVEGPQNWGPEIHCGSGQGLKKYEDQRLYSLVYRDAGESGCVIVGFPAEHVEQVRKEVSVDNLLKRLGELPGIVAVQLVAAGETGVNAESPMAELVEREGSRVTESRIRIGDSDLIVIQRAGHFAKRMHQMRTEFFIFVAILAAFGAISSWWLYYVERLRLQEAREYEQEMARQHEEAVLGRSAATIAHEIRNPLNAIGMGLQRLQLETRGLDEEHLALLVSMREAVARSNSIVTSLQQYVRSFEVVAEQVDIAALLQGVVKLYSPACEEQGVDIVLSADHGYTVPGDSRLLTQLFENVVKNSMEAQPQGGYSRIDVTWTKTACRVRLENGGYMLPDGESSKLFEPYFTSKTQGTGLGLAISRKIVEAHGGWIEAYPDTAARKFVLVIELPRK